MNIKLKHQTTDIVETLLYSHLYTLIKLWDVRTFQELKHVIDTKLINTNALNDIMDYHAMNSDVSMVSFKHNDDMRRALEVTIKTLKHDIKG